ncbi:aminobenzoyl-glutamate transport protein [Parelusimicrobium proximum]|uniref:AbgT family transporter n=1 Tax=Parelusimicrobium proximum TaxID=3228953 RepID=UPI003D18169F
MNTQEANKSLIFRFLNFIEVVGNKLPHPVILFAVLALSVIILSWLCSMLGITATHPTTHAVISPVNLLSKEGVQLILTKLVTNFTGFAPLGTVLVAIMGIGIAEHSGLLKTVLRSIVEAAPSSLITVVVVFSGVLSNMASDIGYVLLVPLGGIIFLSVGRHPIAGIAAAFAGVSGGFSANLLLGTIDPLVAGLSQEAARILPEYAEYTVSPACNYYFMFISTFLITALGTLVTEKIVEPRLGKYEGEQTVVKEKVTKEEKRGMLFAFIALVILTALLLICVLPENGILRSPTGGILKSPFMSSIVAFIFIFGSVCGIAYGIGARSIKASGDVVGYMTKAMATMASYLVLVFFAAQFVAYFNQTNLGLIFAIKGAGLLTSFNLHPIILMILFIILSAFINLFMGSASAKWAIMAPVFIPMFMLMGFTPEATQGAYRIGDSITNIISPMMPYFAVILAFFNTYDKKAGIGTMVSTMIPYTIVFGIGWTILFAIWMGLGLPLGPGAGFHL